jgi:hypothetical protein
MLYILVIRTVAVSYVYQYNPYAVVCCFQSVMCAMCIVYKFSGIKFKLKMMQSQCFAQLLCMIYKIL